MQGVAKAQLPNLEPDVELEVATPATPLGGRYRRAGKPRHFVSRMQPRQGQGATKRVLQLGCRRVPHLFYLHERLPRLLSIQIGNAVASWRPGHCGECRVSPDPAERIPGATPR